MCGIAGAWDFTGRSIPMGRIAAMSREQQHRGPDGDGVFSNGPLFLANQRLAIIDPDDGDQPFMSDDGAVALVQNGEIFNFVELADELRGHGVRFRTHCDTEVLLQAYLHWGPDFVRRLNGMFAIAIWDARDRTLRLYRDRIGIKPLFYHEDGKGFSFASEIKALLAGGVPANHDPQALDLFFTYNYVPPPHTAFRSIFHLPPGTIAEVVEGGGSAYEGGGRCAIGTSPATMRMPGRRASSNCSKMRCDCGCGPMSRSVRSCRAAWILPVWLAS